MEAIGGAVMEWCVEAIGGVGMPSASACAGVGWSCPVPLHVRGWGWKHRPTPPYLSRGAAAVGSRIQHVMVAIWIQDPVYPSGMLHSTAAQLVGWYLIGVVCGCTG